MIRKEIRDNKTIIITDTIFNGEVITIDTSKIENVGCLFSKSFPCIDLTNNDNIVFRTLSIGMNYIDDKIVITTTIEDKNNESRETIIEVPDEETIVNSLVSCLTENISYTKSFATYVSEAIKTAMLHLIKKGYFIKQHLNYNGTIKELDNDTIGVCNRVFYNQSSDTVFLAEVILKDDAIIDDFNPVDVIVELDENTHLNIMLLNGETSHDIGPQTIKYIEGKIGNIKLVDVTEKMNILKIKNIDLLELPEYDWDSTCNDYAEDLSRETDEQNYVKYFKSNKIKSMLRLNINNLLLGGDNVVNN